MLVLGWVLCVHAYNNMCVYVFFPLSIMSAVFLLPGTSALTVGAVALLCANLYVIYTKKSGASVRALCFVVCTCESVTVATVVGCRPGAPRPLRDLGGRDDWLCCVVVFG